MPKESAEPNLTPLLDIVFQLITFFMLVINFASDNYDRASICPTPARPGRWKTPSASSEDRLVLNIDKDGNLLTGNEVQPLQRGDQGDQASGRPGEAQPQGGGREARPGDQRPADDDHPPGRQGRRLSSVLSLIKTASPTGFRKFALKAMMTWTDRPVRVQLRLEGDAPVKRRVASLKGRRSRTVPVAPMLDMAFQLLTFFILTYRACRSRGSS